MPFSLLTLVSVVIGGAIQIIPTVTMSRAENIEDRLQALYTPLELAGRDIYISEGCYNCHSQMIRMMVPDVLRYGPGAEEGYSRMGESIYDFPFQWGSKRTGPDLAREGGPLVDGKTYMRVGKQSNIWHYNHMIDPRSINTDSNMPAYPWLAEKKADIQALPGKIAAQIKLGVPYDAMNKHEIEQMALEQGMEIATDLKEQGAYVEHDTQLVALISYLQKIGVYENVEKEKSEVNPFDQFPSPKVPDGHREQAEKLKDQLGSN